MTENGSIQLNGKTALITGASRGIGRALAEAFLKAGSAVMLTAKDPRRLAQTAEALRKISPHVAQTPCDVVDARQVDALVQTTVERFKTVDILINNAGIIGPMGPAWENNPRQWQQTLEVNLVGTFLCARAVVPVMIRQGGGKILNLSGKGAAYPWPRFSAYGVSKAAVVRFTETLAEEAKPFNIQVNVIAPGSNNTDLLQTAAKAEPELLNNLPEDFEKPCRLALFLASPESDQITGKFVHVNQNWRKWTKEHLAGDVLTLRRVSLP